MAISKLKKKKAVSGAKSTSSATNSATGEDLRRLERILEMMGQHQVAELAWETPAGKLHLRTQASFTAAAPVYAAAPNYAPPMNYAPPANYGQAAASAPSASASAPGPAVANGNLKEMTSPLVGTYYASSAPGKEPFVKVGQTVNKGDTLCIIEAMKCMNPIPSEYSGKIASILADNQQVVEYGVPLFLIEAH